MGGAVRDTVQRSDDPWSLEWETKIYEKQFRQTVSEQHFPFHAPQRPRHNPWVSSRTRLVENHRLTKTPVGPIKYFLCITHRIAISQPQLTRPIFFFGHTPTEEWEGAETAHRVITYYNGRPGMGYRSPVPVIKYILKYNCSKRQLNWNMWVNHTGKSIRLRSSIVFLIFFYRNSSIRIRATPGNEKLDSGQIGVKSWGEGQALGKSKIY